MNSTSTTRTPCCSPVYCDLVRAIEKLRQEHPYARIELSIRNHQIIHADLKVETNVRVPMRKTGGSGRWSVESKSARE
ncbi:MAG: hypothetical protein OXN17_08305 [Candidatus Poribacteria bacterium]|nr:hypothetical protein [Candidatus Poribacteria bacterium]MDE0505798.1 hypothetical protein [Candidatus Poribacteria bacterium]